MNSYFACICLVDLNTFRGGKFGSKTIFQKVLMLAEAASEQSLKYLFQNFVSLRNVHDTVYSMEVKVWKSVIQAACGSLYKYKYLFLKALCQGPT